MELSYGLQLGISCCGELVILSAAKEILSQEILCFTQNGSCGGEII